MNNNHGLVILSGRAGRSLGESICKHLCVELCDDPCNHERMELGKLESYEAFANGEWRPKILTDITEKHVVIVNPTNPPGDNLLDIVLLADAAHYESPADMTFIPTYLAWSRQERLDKPGTPISARLAIDIFNARKPKTILFTELHAEAIQGFVYPAIAKEIYGAKILVPYIQQHYNLSNMKIVAADGGAIDRGRAYNKFLGIKQPIAICYKGAREFANTVNENEIILVGDVDGYECLLPEDMADTLGTLIADGSVLKKHGAKKVIGTATFGLFSKKKGDPRTAFEKLMESDVDELIITDAIPHPAEVLAACPKIKVVSISELYAEAIKRIYKGRNFHDLVLKTK